ncbi:MAG: discoidin domain-containing protein [Fibrobacteres bacterium]|nr:discoidin domain-containing protein [Fibrobacterota bacterium]
MVRQLIAGVLFMTIFPVSAFTATTFAELYVAPNGSGAACSKSSPGSLNSAREKIRTMNKTMNGDIVVFLRGGLYTLESTFLLQPEDSGGNGFHVVYKAFPGETPVLSGGKAVTGWALFDTAKNIYRAPVTPGLNTRQLYVNGTRATRARGAQNPSGFAKVAKGFTTTDTNMQYWKNISDIEIVSFYNWKMFRMGIDTINASAINMKEPCWSGSLVHSCCVFGNVGWIENALELLSDEGEWYLDKHEGFLYYKPRTSRQESMSNAEVIMPILETLIQGAGSSSNPVHHIQFEGITFSHATWLAPSNDTGYADIQAGVHIFNPGTTLENSGSRATPGNLTFTACNNIVFRNNTFTHLGAVGLELSNGCIDNLVEGNRFTDIASSGIQIGAINPLQGKLKSPPDDAWTLPHNNVIRNNSVSYIGADYYDACGIIAFYTDSTIIEHNEIYNIPYTGISLGWGWSNALTVAGNNKIRSNLIHHFMQKLVDGGGVYTLGAQPGSEVCYNYIHHQGNEYGMLYPDEGSSYMNWHHNVTANGVRWLHMWTSTIQQDTVEDNYHDNDVATLKGANCIVRNNPLVSGGEWPQEALTIIEQAGLEAGYDHMLPVTNLAKSGSAWASSEYSTQHTASKVIDDNLSSGWSPLGSDTRPWIIIDLLKPAYIEQIELVTRQDMDQVSTRRNFEIQLSNTSDFSNFKVVAYQDSLALNYQATFTALVTNTQSYRYVRFIKSVDEYFFITECRVMGKQISGSTDGEPDVLTPKQQPFFAIAGNPGIPAFYITLFQTATAKLAIYNTAGQKVQEVFTKKLNAGTHTFNWQPESSLACGLYVARITCADKNIERKFMLLR